MDDAGRAPVSHAAPHRVAIESRSAPPDDGSFEIAVQVSDLHKTYASGAPALRGITFDVRRGEVLAMLGPNGAGKTTAVEILAGCRERSAGDVQVLGLDPGNRTSRRALRQRTGIVLQSSGNHRYLSVRETLEMHRAYHPDPRAVDEVLGLVGLQEVEHRRVRELSGGQQRRLDVGVALVGRPELIFLDEPTTGFDPAARRRMWSVVRGLVELGTSVMLTTHYMEEAQELADRVLVLSRGAVAGYGTPAELAAGLRLTTTVQFMLPPETSVEALPAVIAAQVVSVDHEATGSHGAHRCAVEIVTSDATRCLGVLTGWALEFGVDLDGLRVEPPNLERSYLALTEEAGS